MKKKPQTQQNTYTLYTVEELKSRPLEDAEDQSRVMKQQLIYVYEYLSEKYDLMRRYLSLPAD